jgi:hypothetical protein
MVIVTEPTPPPVSSPASPHPNTESTSPRPPRQCQTWTVKCRLCYRVSAGRRWYFNNRFLLKVIDTKCKLFNVSNNCQLRNHQRSLIKTNETINVRHPLRHSTGFLVQLAPAVLTGSYQKRDVLRSKSAHELEWEGKDLTRRSSLPSLLETWMSSKVFSEKTLLLIQVLRRELDCQLNEVRISGLFFLIIFSLSD